jgi:hypothetical protein
VNVFMRGLGRGLLALAILGITGCGADNETEAEKLSKGMGDPGPGTAKVDPSQQAVPAVTGPTGYPTSPPKNDMGKSYPLAKKKS